MVRWVVCRLFLFFYGWEWALLFIINIIMSVSLINGQGKYFREITKLMEPLWINLSIHIHRVNTTSQVHNIILFYLFFYSNKNQTWSNCANYYAIARPCAHHSIHMYLKVWSGFRGLVIWHSVEKWRKKNMLFH